MFFERPGEEEHCIAPRTSNENVDLSLVLREIHHRTANSLTLLVASLRSEFEIFADPGVQEAMLRHEKQIVALGEFHSYFAVGLSNGQLSAHDYFRPLCTVLSQSVLEPLGVHCDVFIGDGLLPAAKCQWLGLIVAELVMNAAKYAFEDGVAGRISITIDHNNGLWSCLVSDNGVGMRNFARGTGSQITDSLTEALGGKSAIRTGAFGTAVSIEFRT